MSDPIKDGRSTSEYEVTKSAGVWGIIALILGFVTSGVAPILAKFGVIEGSTVGIVAGAVIAVAGVALQLLTKLGYIRGRAELKMAKEIKNKDEG